MTDNRLKLIISDGANRKVVRARNRLIRLYNALRHEGGWRAVARERGSKNQQYIYNFAMHGIEPPNPRERKACFLPDRICETCKRPVRDKKPHVHIEVPEWVKKWRKLPKEKRYDIIHGLMTDEYALTRR